MHRHGALSLFGGGSASPSETKMKNFAACVASVHTLPSQDHSTAGGGRHQASGKQLGSQLPHRLPACLLPCFFLSLALRGGELMPMSCIPMGSWTQNIILCSFWEEGGTGWDLLLPDLKLCMGGCHCCFAVAACFLPSSAYPSSQQLSNLLLPSLAFSLSFLPRLTRHFSVAGVLWAALFLRRRLGSAL